jgi:hypothetical protein
MSWSPVPKPGDAVSNLPPPESDALTPADIRTPHNDPEQKRIEEESTEVIQGLLDPRQLPGPELLEPPPLTLPVPSKPTLEEGLSKE